MDNYFDITGADFRALKVILGTMAIDDVRYYLEGVFVEQIRPGRVRLVSTDGHGLSYLEVDAPEEFQVPDGDSSKSVILPQRFLRKRGGWPVRNKTAHGIRITLSEKGWNWASLDKSGGAGPWKTCLDIADLPPWNDTEKDRERLPYITGRFPDYRRVIRDDAENWSVEVPIQYFRDSLAWYVDTWNVMVDVFNEEHQGENFMLPKWSDKLGSYGMRKINMDRYAEGGPKLKPRKLAAGGRIPASFPDLLIGFDWSDFGSSPSINGWLGKLMEFLPKERIPSPPVIGTDFKGEGYDDSTRHFDMNFINSIVDFPGDRAEVSGAGYSDTMQIKTTGDALELFLTIMPSRT